MAFSRSSRIEFDWCPIYELLLKIRTGAIICCQPMSTCYLPRFFKKDHRFKIVYWRARKYEANLWLKILCLLKIKEKQKLAKSSIRMEQPNGSILFLFAESCYKNEMPEKTPFLILENKLWVTFSRFSPKNYHDKKKQFKFLNFRNLTPAYGTVETIAWYREIHTFIPVELADYWPCSLDFYRRLLKNYRKWSFNFLELINIPVPHSQLFTSLW